MPGSLSLCLAITDDEYNRRDAYQHQNYSFNHSSFSL